MSFSYFAISELSLNFAHRRQYLLLRFDFICGLKCYLVMLGLSDLNFT